MVFTPRFWIRPMDTSGLVFAMAPLVLPGSFGGILGLSWWPAERLGPGPRRNHGPSVSHSGEDLVLV